MIRHILLPTDGSEGALTAARQAGELARAIGAKVSVLVVQDNDLILSHSWGADIQSGVAYGSMTIDEVRGLLTEKVNNNEMPATIQALGALDPEAAREIRFGEPAEEICTFAEESGADLIVMGSHGRQGLRRLILGSVSERVAARAPCAVMIAR